MTGFSKRFNAKEWVILGTSVLLLLITLTFPFNYDHTIFMIGGEKMVLHGGIPFRDVLDTKPLMIMYLYGFSSALFGHSMVSIRLVDLVFQLVSLYFVYRISKRIFNDDEIAPWSVLLYSLLYVSFDYTATAQAETFALLPALFITDVVTRAIKNAKVINVIPVSIAVAFASVFILLLKVSLVVIPVSLLGFLLFKKGIRSHIHFVILSLGFSIILLGGFLSYLYLCGAFESMLHAFKWLSDYSNFHNADTINTAGTWALRELPRNFIQVYSFTGLILLGMGIYISLKELRIKQSTKFWSDRTYIYLFFTVFALCFSTIIYERKFWGYSFTRLLFCSLPFIIFPLVEFTGFFRMKATKPTITKMNIPYKLIVSLVVIVILFFSPLYSLADRGIRRIVIAYQEEDIFQDLHQTDWFNTIADQRDLSDTLKKFVKKDDDIYIWGNHVGAYYFLDKVPPTFMITSVMIISPWTPQIWKEQVIRELETNKPDHFIIEHFDYVDILTGYKHDSYMGMAQWKHLQSFLENNYDSVTNTHNFSIFSRRAGK